ncbi:MAG: acetyl-CoA carboxylase biotin carboxyl carrier protein subunit [Deltaproteobacteria bacterium]|nr:acetyl-CoA carboxylase biotin carboxyl carrier protein subunit [Deltaproteobacteria bacterium]
MKNGEVRSPGVGKVIEILVTAGAQVAAGDEVIVIESMKVEIPVTASRAGRVERIVVATGDQVQADDLLLTISV